jgi:hypothetical protein
MPTPKPVHLFHDGAAHIIGTASSWEEVATRISAYAAAEHGSLSLLLRAHQRQVDLWHISPRNGRERGDSWCVTLYAEP